VTGGAGAVGARLVPKLREAGWHTRCLVHRRPVEGADELVRGDLADAASLDRPAVGAAAVLHLAALTHSRNPRAYYEVNVGGTARLLDAARRGGARRFVLVSTRAIAEDGGAYSRSKARSEAAVAEAGLEHTIVRLPEVYGAGSREGVDRIVEKARAGGVIPLVGDGSDHACPAFVDDVIRALVASLSSPAAGGKTYTLAGECMTLRELADRCLRFYCSGGRVQPIPVPAVRLLGALGRIAPVPVYPDQLRRLRAEKPPPSREAHRELGFEPRSLEEGLRTLTDDAPSVGA